ncbi:hypothetical protein [Pseudomonas sp. B35(2017)]|uniref:hypothetical protein n=1 Tax=Pseudomonas sp. B35(2017) TaxID=1981722 RepID=UPI0035325D40
MIALDLAAGGAAVDFLFRLPAAFIGRLLGAGVRQPGVDEQFPQAAQRRLQRLGQRLTADQLRAVQRQQLALVRQAQRLVLRRRQRRNQTQQQPDQRPAHVS